MKPGIKSTEFYLALIAMAFPLLQALAGRLEGPWAPVIVAAIGATYLAARTYVKGKGYYLPPAPGAPTQTDSGYRPASLDASSFSSTRSSRR